MSSFTVLTRLTNDPKLTYIEARLDELDIAHRRNGESSHAPIMEVQTEFYHIAHSLLSREIDMGDGTTKPLDELPDDDILFDDGTSHTEWGMKQAFGPVPMMDPDPDDEYEDDEL